MHIFVPEIGKRVKLSAREAREEKKNLLAHSHNCFADIQPKVHYINELKHIARKNAAADKVAKEKKAKEDAEAAEKKRREPAELRKALERGVELPLEEWLMATYYDEHIPSRCLSTLRSLEGEFHRAGEQNRDYGCLKGKKILDIGCGSEFTNDGNMLFVKLTGFSPWLCRALHKCGAVAVGVDIENNDGEKFEHRLADLSEPGALKKLFGEGESATFDAIVMSSFVNSKENDSSPQLKRMTTKEQRERIEAEMFEEALRLLKEGCLFIHDSRQYRKIDGKMLLVFTWD